MTKIKMLEIIADAERITELFDWGGDEFRLPLETLLKGINDHTSLTELGFERTYQRILQRLCQRLKLMEDRKRRPEITEQEIVQPLFVVGLIRSGTTFTHAMLGADPANNVPLGWQFLIPSPPPNDPAIDHEPAIREAHEMLEFQGLVNQNIRAIHDWSALHPDECARALEFSFTTMSLSGLWNTPEYYKLLTTLDAAPAYRTHKKVLQALQVGVQGRRWVLKAPEHTTQLDALLEVYPDALFVQNHRDPYKVMGSVMPLINAVQRLASDDVNPLNNRDYGLHLIQSFADAQDNLIKLRQNSEIDRRFIDIHYRDIEGDVMAVMKRIYTHADMPFNETAQQAISNWIAINRKGKHGKHSYSNSLSEINITPEEVRTKFKNYIEYFNVEIEM